MAQEKDIVLIYFEDKPVVFARIEDIQADSKKDWYHVKLLLLQTPLQTVTWILRDIYIDGEEFTMNGKRVKLELVICPDSVEVLNEEQEEQEEQKYEQKEVPNHPKVISLADRKK
jgi:hypothetical protein